MVWHPGGRVLLAVSHQARLHRVKDGQTLTLRALPDGAAGIFHDADGFFDGDPQAAELIGIRVGEPFPNVRFLPAQEVAQRFRRPGLAAGFWREAGGVD